MNAAAARARQAFRATWMGSYEKAVIAKNPAAIGRIDWDTATFYFNAGYTPEAAAYEVTTRTHGNHGAKP